MQPAQISTDYQPSDSLFTFAVAGSEEQGHATKIKQGEGTVKQQIKRIPMKHEQSSTDYQPQES